MNFSILIQFQRVFLLLDGSVRISLHFAYMYINGILYFLQSQYDKRCHQNIIYSYHFNSSQNVSLYNNQTSLSKVKTNCMSDIEETLRKAREVDQKFKKFMLQKQQRDKSMAQTFQKLKKAQQTMKSTKQTLNHIDSIYNKIQQGFSNAIDNALKNVQKSVMFNIADPDWKPNKIGAKEFVQILKDKKKIMFLTGAGISAASGIPTFRGSNGFWTQNSNSQSIITEEPTNPQQILTKYYYQNNPFKTWLWLDNFYEMKINAKINKGHQSLQSIIQQLLKKKCEIMLTSQNIDNFHNEAKLENQKKNKSQLKQEQLKYQICQIHGNVMKIRCQNCTQTKKQLCLFNFQDFRKKISQKIQPRCQKCQDILRPHIMFFDQFYSEILNKSETVMNFAKSMDLIVVIGTALQTGLSRTIVQIGLQKKCTIVEINTACQIRRPGTMWMQGQADKILQKIKYEVWKTGI